MSKTLAAYRAARAVELAMDGMSFDEIALELGFADRSGAWRAAQRCLARRQRMAADSYVGASFADLEVIEERAWKRAAAGDLQASRVVLRAIEDRMRLVELLSTRESTAKPDVSSRTLAAASEATPAPRPAEVGDTGHFVSMVV